MLGPRLGGRKMDGDVVGSLDGDGNADSERIQQKWIRG